MKVTELSIPDLLLIEPEVFEDSRGFFFESFNQLGFEKATNISPIFVQENHSKSIKGVLRGLHYQLPPMAQDKLVRVIKGEIFDIAVDIRLDSPTFGQWVSEILSDKNKKQLWIPKGFAHGFFVLSENAEVVYKTNAFYNSEFERCIYWDDSELKIEWPLRGIKPIVSNKDKQGLFLEKADLI
jgi:dTDP-4-dehydrorhamnose 3,5-epimerase